MLLMATPYFMTYQEQRLNHFKHLFIVEHHLKTAGQEPGVFKRYEFTTFDKQLIEFFRETMQEIIDCLPDPRTPANASWNGCRRVFLKNLETLYPR